MPTFSQLADQTYIASLTDEQKQVHYNLQSLEASRESALTAIKGYLADAKTFGFEVDKAVLKGMKNSVKNIDVKIKVLETSSKKKNRAFSNRWHFEIPLEDIQDEGYEEKGGDNPCICCGKNIQKPNYYVHLLTSGNIVSSEEDFEDSQGFFPIGNKCKNRIPNNFYF